MLREASTRVDENLDTTGIVNHAFHVYDDLARDAWAGLEGNDLPQDSPPPHLQSDEGAIDPRSDVGVDSDDDGDFYEEDRQTQPENSSQARAQSLLDEASQTLLFAGARLSSLCATLIILNLCRTHGVLKHVCDRVAEHPRNEYFARDQHIATHRV